MSFKSASIFLKNPQNIFSSGEWTTINYKATSGEPSSTEDRVEPNLVQDTLQMEKAYTKFKHPSRVFYGFRSQGLTITIFLFIFTPPNSRKKL